MPLPSKKERDKHQAGSIAEEFPLSQEDTFKPSLEHIYWANPNSARGTIERCAYQDAHVKAEIRETQGI